MNSFLTNILFINNFLILVVLFKMSLYDFRNYKVRNVDLVLLLILEIVNVSYEGNIEKIILSFLFMLLIFMMFLVLYYLYSNKIGGGDIKVLTIMSLGLNFNIIYILFLASFLAIIFSFIFQKKIVPFIPFIMCGFIVFNLIKCYN